MTVATYLKNLFKRITQDDFLGMASEMAYMLALGIFPFMTFLVSIFGWMGKKTLINPLLNASKTIVPADVVSLIDKVLHEVIIFEKGGTVAVIGLVVTIVVASNAIAVVIKGLNRAYGVEEYRSFIFTRFLSVLMVFANALILFLSINLIIFGKIIINYLSLFTGISHLVINLVSVLRWPLSFFALFFMAGLNYYTLPAIEGFDALKRKSTLFGTLFFCIFWLIGSWSFSVYVNNLNTYNKVYGTIGAFAILMVWLYYTSLIILIGGEINSQAYKKLVRNLKND